MVALTTVWLYYMQIMQCSFNTEIDSKVCRSAVIMKKIMVFLVRWHSDEK